MGWSSQHILLWQMNAILMFMFKLIIDVLRLLKFHYFFISFFYLSICLSVFLSFSLYSYTHVVHFIYSILFFFLNISLKLNSRNTDVSSLASICLAYKYTLQMSLNVSIWNSIVFLWYFFIDEKKIGIFFSVRNLRKKLFVSILSLTSSHKKSYYI